MKTSKIASLACVMIVATVLLLPNGSQGLHLKKASKLSAATGNPVTSLTSGDEYMICSLYWNKCLGTTDGSKWIEGYNEEYILSPINPLNGDRNYNLVWYYNTSSDYVRLSTYSYDKGSLMYMSVTSNTDNTVNLASPPGSWEELSIISRSDYTPYGMSIYGIANSRYVNLYNDSGSYLLDRQISCGQTETFYFYQLS